MLYIKDLTVEIATRPMKRVLNQVSFELRPGQSIAIVGESGAGKSSVLHSILKLLPKTFSARGEISFENSNLLAFSEKQMQLVRGRQISFVFQNCLNSFDPIFTVGSQMDECLRHYFPKMRKADRLVERQKLLATVGLQDSNVSSLFPHELSGGMIQRVAVAQALSGKPDIVLADELINALDSKLQIQTMNLLLDQVRSSGLALLWVTHDLRLARQFADKIIVMREGKIVESSAPEPLFLSPQTSYSQFLLSCLPSGSRRD